MLQSKTIDIGVDYLTLTSKETSRWIDWKQAFAIAASEEKARGHKWVESRLMGYAGEMCGHVFIGRRDDGFLARLTSYAAQDYGMSFEPDACHATRIDLQVTQELAFPRPKFLREAYEYAKALPAKGRTPIGYTCIENSNGGGTLYAGARSSARYGRIYDKGVESLRQAPGTSFRWELELKDTLADQAVNILCGGGQPERAIYSLVGEFFAARDLPVIWSVPKIEERLSIPRIAVDEIGTLRWLEGPVATAFARIADQLGMEFALRAVMRSCCNETTDGAIISTMAQIYTENSPNVG